MIKLKKGLDLPIEGSPQQKVEQGPAVTHVALIGDDLAGMKPSMVVKVGDKVKTGQLLFTDKKTEGVNYTAPGSGEIVEVNRGAKRAFQSVVIKIEGDEHVSFSSYKANDASSYDEKSMKELLMESGMWPSIRRRPFSTVANPQETPSSIFVTAMDTNPLAADPMTVINAEQSAFNEGLKAMSKLCSKVFLCTGENAKVETVSGVERKEFSGPHPAGLVGTHIHFIDPVGEKKFVWHIDYQNLIAIGKLIKTGKLDTQRVVSVAGPMAKNPRLLKTRWGARVSDIVKNETKSGGLRTVSGSVFGGRTAQGSFDYLGRFHNQISLIGEGGKREFLGWHTPGFNKFSVKSIYVSKFLPKMFSFDADTNGSLRSIVPIGSYEKVMPLDILPTFLLRSLMSGNSDMSVKLGALELDEEDLSLCTFVDPCKNDFGPKLRESLTIIEKEG